MSDENDLLDEVFQLKKNEKYDEALSLIGKIMFMSFNNDVTLTHAYWDRSAIYEKIGKYDLALSDINRAMELDPHLSDAMLFNRLSIYTKMGKTEQAIEDCTLLIDIFSKFTDKEGKEHLKDLIMQRNNLKKSLQGL